MEQETKQKPWTGIAAGVLVPVSYTHLGNHNRIEPDPYAATVVQDIFNWKIQGMTNNGIAIRLAESGILAPLEYKRHKGEPLFSGFKMKERCEWTAQAVARILKMCIRDRYSEKCSAYHIVCHRFSSVVQSLKNSIKAYIVACGRAV